MRGRIIKREKILKIINNYIYDSLMSSNLNINYQYGSIIGIILIIQIISGIILSYYYIPDITYAFKSIDYITREVRNGWLIRTIHVNGAGLFFLFVYMHIGRSLLYGSYSKYRVKTWTIGVIILLILIITAFLGYSLIYSNMAYWAIIVITNLLTIIPNYGNEIVTYILGGYNIGNATIHRFYSIHYILPIIILGLTLGHIMTLHEVGGSNPLGISTRTYVPFHPYYTIKDILGFIITFIIIGILIYYYPYILSHPDNFIKANALVTPTHIIPEIYFLALFAILRSIPNKTIGVIVLMGSIVSLLILPIIHKGLYHTSILRPIYRYTLYIFYINFILLTIIGESPVEEPYSTAGRILLIYYYIFIYIIIPITSIIETGITIYPYYKAGEIGKE